LLETERKENDAQTMRSKYSVSLSLEPTNGSDVKPIGCSACWKMLKAKSLRLGLKLSRTQVHRKLVPTTRAIPPGVTEIQLGKMKQMKRPFAAPSDCISDSSDRRGTQLIPTQPQLARVPGLITTSIPPLIASLRRSVEIAKDPELWNQ
jgi:hypothetical protein